MGVTKEAVYSMEQVELANLIRAIAHPARIAILEQLLNMDQCMCGDIVDELDLAQATVSQHLKAMKEAGIIKGTVEGRNVCYCVDQEKYELLRSKMSTLLRPCRQQDNCC